MIDRQNLALVFARLGAEVSDWADASERLESIGLTVPAEHAVTLQSLDAMTQHLKEISALLLRLSAATDDGATLSPDEVNRFTRLITLAGLQQRLTGEVNVTAEAGEVCELWLA
ncbi:hypothetical protein [Brevundimonas bacteroides]|uniref:hypothetical protein n=1 Tax=Brevundimonas bacteroides TaxID=74311 RepID=UPI0004965F3B|nr:hypothetical protein [Brevundimonas bacteroides]